MISFNKPRIKDYTNCILNLLFCFLSNRALRKRSGQAFSRDYIWLLKKVSTALNRTKNQHSFTVYLKSKKKRHFKKCRFFCLKFYSSKAFQPLAFKGILVLPLVTKWIPSLSCVMWPIIVKFGFAFIFSKSSIAIVKSNS